MENKEILASINKKELVKNQNDLLSELNKINWDFKDSETNTSTNAIHPYPAKYIPQIPKVIIQTLTNPGDTVYDPFLGSGTTGVEANILGRHAIGNDVNELAVLISKVKTTPISADRLIALDEFLINLNDKIISHYSGNGEKLEIPEIINLDLWFKSFVINEIVIIKNLINDIIDNDLRDLCFVALSAILINVSNQDSDTRYVRVPKNLTHFYTYNRFVSQVKKLRKIMLVSSRELANGNSVFKLADTRKKGVFPSNSAHLAMTSPPYPNAYDYHLYHKYRLFWLGMDPRQLRKLEIGAHADYSKKNNGLDEFDFKNDMEKCFQNTSDILYPGSYFVLVIGNSILKGRTIENNLLLKDAARTTPFVFVKEYSRTINSNKKSFNPVIGNIKTEKIVIFRNDK